MEFSGDTKDVPKEKKVKVDFRLKSRDEHV